MEPRLLTVVSEYMAQVTPNLVVYMDDPYKKKDLLFVPVPYSAVRARDRDRTGRRATTVQKRFSAGPEVHSHPQQYTIEYYIAFYIIFISCCY